MRRRRTSLQNLYLRVLLSMTVSIAVILTAVTALTVAISQEQLKDEMLARADHSINILSYAASVYAAQHDTHQLLRTAQAAAKGDTIQFIAFFDEHGEILTTAAAPTAHTSMRRSFGDLPQLAQAEHKPVVRWSAESLDLANVIVYQGQDVGTVALRLDTGTLREGFMWEVLRSAVTAALLAVCISIVVGAVLHRLVIVPLRQLSATADHISQGRWAVPPGQDRSDEFGRVARSFSRMVSVLQARESQITLIVRADGQIIEANQAAAAAYHCERESLLALPFHDLEVEPASDRVGRLWHEPLETLVFEANHRRGDGSVFPVEVAARRAVIDGMRVVIADIRDITERRQAEASLANERALLAQRVEERTAELSAANAALARALRLKDEFLAMMSHELRTPLTAILGYTETIAEGAYGPVNDRQRHGLGVVLQSGRHLLAILSDILDLAHIEAGRTSMDLRSVMVVRICRMALDIVQAPAQQRGINLRLDLTAAPSHIRADERRLTQILVNLLDNAVKFTPQGGTVGLAVELDAAADQVRFRVTDTGIGIDTADIERVFQPFTQVDGRLARSYGGIGLGLALVRRLVDLHGGSILVESALGQGSTFTVTLPSAAEAPAAPAKAAPDARAAVGRTGRILIADDHETTLSFYVDLLSASGFHVTAARTGDEALAQIRADAPDAAVLDIQMPGMDGLTLIQHIRQEPSLQALPIVALTALTMPGDRERCLAAGANVYLAKPVGLRALIATLEELLPPAQAGRDAAAEPALPGA